MSNLATATRFEFQKDRVLRAAARCFNQKGFSGTSLKDVANELGLTDPALYHYVRNKEELVYLCYVRAADLGREAMDMAIKKGGSGFDVVVNYLTYHVEMMVGERGPIAIMSEIPSLNPEHREEILEVSREHSRRFEELLQAGIDDGSVATCNVRMTGNAIMGAMNWIPKWYRGDAGTAREMIEQYPATLVRGLAAG
ncbi:MAG: TetR/AcrR family transcriptional regulator [Pseudomonadota bacterium]